MILKSALLLLALSAAVATAAETKLDPAERWLARQFVGNRQQVVGDLTLQEIQVRLLQQFANVASQVPQFNDLARNPNAQSGISRQHAQYIAQILEKDFDNDGVVTRAELEIFYTPQSKLALRTVQGVQIAPTPEQSTEILSKLISRDMQADNNGDGSITFDEMRAAAERAELPPYARVLTAMRLMDPIVVGAFDTSGDHIVSRQEFSTAIQKTFAAIDTDKNGILSATEMQPFQPFRWPGMNNTF